ncbi:MAG: hypothetical protein IT320_27505 [Anaerolineae bacterium]|nr:hypothetical protein [Anaerolineae bacterium]
MPARDKYHDTVVAALERDGWTISGQQVTFITSERQIVIDIAASRVSGENIILVEVKGFERSPVEELAIAMGKLAIYRYVLSELELSFPVWLAVPEAAFQGIFSQRIGKRMCEQFAVSLLVFSPERKEIIQWIPFAKS